MRVKDQFKWQKPPSPKSGFRIVDAVGKDIWYVYDPDFIESHEDGSHVSGRYLVRDELKAWLVRGLGGDLVEINEDGDEYEWLTRGKNAQGFNEGLVAYELGKYTHRQLVRDFFIVSRGRDTGEHKGKSEDERILWFANKYGHLGIQTEIREIVAVRDEHLCRSKTLGENLLLGESKQQWLELAGEVASCYEGLLALGRGSADAEWEALLKWAGVDWRYHEGDLKTALRHAEARHKDSGTPLEGISSTEDPGAMLLDLISETIERKFRLYVGVSLEGDARRRELLPLLQPNTLLGAIWLMLYQMRSGSASYRRCLECGEHYLWEGGTGDRRFPRSDRRTCSPACRGRRHRRHKNESTIDWDQSRPAGEEALRVMGELVKSDCTNAVIEVAPDLVDECLRALGTAKDELFPDVWFKTRKNGDELVIYRSWSERVRERGEALRAAGEKLHSPE